MPLRPVDQLLAFILLSCLSPVVMQSDGVRQSGSLARLSSKSLLLAFRWLGAARAVMHIGR